MDKFFQGVAVVIDDEVNDQSANISKVVEQIEGENIPVLKLDKIPENDVVNHFQNLSFLIIDWVFDDPSLTDTPEVSVPEGLVQYNADKNIEFLKEVTKVCFCPIFIFSNEKTEDIKASLEENDLNLSNILLREKNSIEDGNLFESVTSWLKDTPSIYVLREWDFEYQQCKNRLFNDFQKLSDNWPYIMWKNFSDDGVNKSLELGDLISKNLQSRMTPFDFQDDLLNKDISGFNPKEINSVIVGERFLHKDTLHSDDICTGDIFCEEDDDGKRLYHINIRPQCDLLRAKNNNPKLYLLKGRVLNELNSSDISEGHIIEKHNEFIVPYLDDGVVISFKMIDLKVKPWNSFKEKRVGRLLSPHINRLPEFR